MKTYLEGHVIGFVSTFCTYVICKVYCGHYSNNTQMSRHSKKGILLKCSWVSAETVVKHFIPMQKSCSLLVPGEFLLL